MIYQDKKNLERYEKLIKNLIHKSFPTLKNKKIKIYEYKFTRGPSADAERLPFYLRIRTNIRLRDYSEGKLIGTFAHELCHLEKFVSLSWFHYYIIRDFQKSKKFIKKEEKETDIETIKKGYAKQLYLQRKSRWKSNVKKDKKLKKMYLSPIEIRKIAIKLKKWK